MGKVIVSGGCRATFPTVEILANTLEIGTAVKLMEDGIATEFLVVHQGLPSDLYDTSCEGTWLLRKNIKSDSVWNSNSVNTYPNLNTTIRLYLEGDYFNSLGTTEQNVVKQVKIPYGAGGGVATVFSGKRGYSTKVFLLGGYEVGYTTTIISDIPVDGAKLGYFIVGSDNVANKKRIALYENNATSWWLRSPSTSSSASSSGYKINNTGKYARASVGGRFGVRPALIIPSTTRFDRNTLLLKG